MLLNTKIPYVPAASPGLQACSSSASHTQGSGELQHIRSIAGTVHSDFGSHH